MVDIHQGKVKVQLSGVSASMLGCLWGRAQVSKEYSSLFCDAKAIELVERIDYDLSMSDVLLQGIWLNVLCKLNLPEFSIVFSCTGTWANNRR